MQGSSTNPIIPVPCNLLSRCHPVRWTDGAALKQWKKRIMCCYRVRARRSKEYCVLTYPGRDLNCIRRECSKPESNVSNQMYQKKGEWRLLSGMNLTYLLPMQQPPQHLTVQQLEWLTQKFKILLQFQSSGSDLWEEVRHWCLVM